ncbi:MAG: iron ABC transporter permease [Armatimonadota bacterium]|nr:iron ABC transporter permease [Armatimonadota bacterium]
MRSGSATAAVRALWRSGRRPVPWALLAPSAAVAAVIAGPMVFLLGRALLDGRETLLTLSDSQTMTLLASTLVLAAVSSVGSAATGAGLAFLVERTDLPWRAAWRIVLALPLAIPPYIGAIVYLHLLSRGGVLDRLIGLALPPHGLAGSAFVIALYTYPYSFLLTSAALRRVSRSLDEVARGSGLSSGRILWTVTLPLIRPAIGAGLFFPALYALADFGTVVLLRYDTLATELYYLLTAFYRRSAAAALGTAAILLVLAFLWLEARLRGRARYHQSDASWKPPEAVRLGRYRLPALAAVAAAVVLALVLPVILLAGWAYAGAVRPSGAERLWAASASSPWKAAGESLLLGVLASTVIVGLAVPPAYLRVRSPGWPAWAIWALGQAGYALPGIVIVLGVAFLTNTVAPWLYGTLPVMIGAFMVRYISQGLRAVETGLLQIPQRLGEAARGLGERPVRAFLRVDLPLLRPSVIAGWALVFLNVLKDLPVNLLLRPAGFDTLPVRTWLSATDGIYTQAALPSLLLIACAALPLAILLRAERARGVAVA